LRFVYEFPDAWLAVAAGAFGRSCPGPPVTPTIPITVVERRKSRWRKF
jgi:hypothetical protein